VIVPQLAEKTLDSGAGSKTAFRSFGLSRSHRFSGFEGSSRDQDVRVA